VDVDEGGGGEEVVLDEGGGELVVVGGGEEHDSDTLAPAGSGSDEIGAPTGRWKVRVVPVNGRVAVTMQSASEALGIAPRAAMVASVATATTSFRLLITVA
jgi:hypothetical protein